MFSLRKSYFCIAFAAGSMLSGTAQSRIAVNGGQLQQAYRDAQKLYE